MGWMGWNESLILKVKSFLVERWVERLRGEVVLAKYSKGERGGKSEKREREMSRRKHKQIRSCRGDAERRAMSE